jgi:putative ABC transport system permease protein
MSEQVSFFLEKDMGYDKTSVLTVTSAPRIWSDEGFNKMDAAKRKFLTSPKIKAISLSWGAPGNLSPLSAAVFRLGQTSDNALQTTITCTDEDYLNVYDIKLQAGRFFTDETGVRLPNALVLNASAQKALGVQIGEKVNIQFTNAVEFTVVGVMDDFNFESLHQTVKPVAFMHNRDFFAYRYFSIKLNSGNLSASVREVEKIWKEVFPNEPFVYSFIDEKLQELYKTELQLKKASTIASALMLVIVMTGVLGLVSINVGKRTKEIGIRKVLGANIPDILLLISKEYVLVMLLAFSIGIPLSYLFIADWLDGFAYHINLSWWMFAIPVLILFLVTLMIVGCQSFKTLMDNPVKALKYE